MSPLRTAALWRAAILVVFLSLCRFNYSASSSSSSSSSTSCPAEFAEKHKAIDAKIGDSESGLIKGASPFQFGNESKEVVMFAMAGDENRNVIVVSMPGVMLDIGIDIGGVSSPTSVFVSENGGVDFTRKLKAKEEDEEEFHGRKDNGLQPSPIDKNRIILVGYGPKNKRMKESTLYVSEDAGVEWTKRPTKFRVDGAISFHGSDRDLLLAYSRSADFSVHLSEDFGKTWKRIQSFVRSVHWGFFDRTIFATVDENVGKWGAAAIGRLMKSVDLGETWTQALDDVHSFGLEGKFLYASVEEGGNVNKRVLMVSDDDGKTWNHVQLPNITPDRFYSILDMSEELIFIHVSNPHSADHGTLYTSGSNGTVFSESMERHLFTHSTITDFYRVKSMRGVFITSKVNEDLSLTTMITYNRGATWQRIKAPANFAAKCKNAAKCSLQLHVSFSVAEYNAAPQGPLSIADATGLIIAHGHVDDSLQTKEVQVFISSDGGTNWRYTGLDGFFYYQILDYGGLIVAVKIPRRDDDDDDSKLIYFSTDEGRCWHSRNYTDQRIFVKGLRAEPNGHSLLVSVWGMVKVEEGRHQWVVVTVDFAKILVDKCKEKDYDDWTPSVGGATNQDDDFKGCQMGEKLTYKRLKAMSFCHNDESILSSVLSSACPCQKSDFDCAFGFERKNGDCVKSEHVENGAERPMLCLQGKVYVVDDNKYRKIPGDKCNETLEKSFKAPDHGLSLLQPERSCNEESKALLLAATRAPAASSAPKTPAQKTALAAIICVSLLLFSLCTVFFARKFVALRNDRGSYRYSTVRATDDDEFEALLPNSDADRSNAGLGDYVVAAEDDDGDDDDDFDLEMELERGLAQLNAPLPSSSSSASRGGGAGSPPELPVTASKSPLKAPPSQTPNIRSYLSDSDDDMIA